MMKFSNFLNRLFTKWWLCLLFLIVAGICFGYLVPKAQKPIFANCTDVKVTQVLDERMMTWTAEDAKQFYNAVGSEGRQAYRLFFLKLDFWFPALSASLFYISLLSYAFPIGSKYSKLNLLPILGWLMDVFENINHYSMAGAYPNLSSFSLTFGPVFTFAKWFFVMAIPIIALFGFSIRFFNKNSKMKRQLTSLLVTFFVSTLIFSCSDAEKRATGEQISKPTFDLTMAKKQIEEVNRNYSEFVAKGDSIGVANLYAKDARILFAGTPVVVAGRANIQTAFSRFINSGITKLEIETVEIFGTEDLLAEEGKVTIYVKDKVVANEKSIILWKKEEGKWKVFRDIANSNAK